MKSHGSSLAKDLKLLINNSVYSDLKIVCEDNETLYGCRAILAARSEVLDKLLFNGMKESKQNEIKFPEIKSCAMKIILEFLYTDEVNYTAFTPNNIIDTFHAADYFQLPDLQDQLVEYVKKELNGGNNNQVLAPELLSNAVRKMSASAENDLIKLLTEHVALISLDTVKYGELSFQGLQCLLSQTFTTKEPFATPEYTVFRYTVIQAAKHVSDEASYLFEKRLPALSKIDEAHRFDDDQSKYEEIRETITEILSSILPYIDLRRIDVNVLADIIEPLGIIPVNVLLDTYRFQAKEKRSLAPIRGTPLYKWDLQWDIRARGINLVLRDENHIVESPKSGQSGHHNIRANKMISGEGIYEWDVTIEETCTYAWVGVCTERGLDYSLFAGQQSCAWVLGSSGKCYHNNIGTNYVAEFGNGTNITVHLNMTDKTIAFSINGIRYPNVSAWKNLPSKLYPVASLNPPGRIRIG
ncbi:6310_t:CDS:1 [Acaulospora colombiana]|uniref:6310_t:CDS:1 n=1 Tax=Acaulospora colombiana TaxID=27376 RepID=A0ACA9JXP5_9GLOM|nr:6310_t:CDS:1 [Acaulospora colombiana]